MIFAAVDAFHSTGSRDAEFDGDEQTVYGTISGFHRVLVRIADWRECENWSEDRM